MPPSPARGSGLPTEAQLARLQALCSQTGQRYFKPRSADQARSLIRDLEIRARVSARRVLPAQQRPHPKSQNRKRARRGPGGASTWADLPDLLARLKRAHYGYAKALEHGRPTNGQDRQAAALERQIDRLMETPLDR